MGERGDAEGSDRDRRLEWSKQSQFTSHCFFFVRTHTTHSASALSAAGTVSVMGEFSG